MLTGLFSARNKRFNRHFDAVGEHLQKMSDYMRDAFCGNDVAIRGIITAMKTEEAAILSIVATLRNDAGNTLFNSIDREDIHFLAADLKLLAGNILHTTSQLKNLGTAKLPAEIQNILPLMADTIKELANILKMLKDMAKLKELTDSCLSVRQAFYKCDAMIDDITTEALNSMKNPLELIQLTDLFAALQRLLEKAGAVVDNSETIIIKYS